MLEVSSSTVTNWIKGRSRPLNRILEQTSHILTPPPTTQLGYEFLNGEQLFTSNGFCPDIVSGLAKGLHNRYGFNLEIYYVFLVHDTFRIPHFLLRLVTPDLDLGVDGSFGQISGSRNRIVTFKFNKLNRIFRPQEITPDDTSEPFFKSRNWTKKENLLIGRFRDIGDISSKINYRGKVVTIAEVIAGNLD